MRASTSLGLGAALVVACGGPSVAVKPVEVAPEVSAPVATELPDRWVLLVSRWGGALEPLLCCEAGECRYDGCTAMVPDGAEVALDTGETVRVHPGEHVECYIKDDIPGRDMLTIDGDGSASEDVLAIWPASATGAFRWRELSTHPLGMDDQLRAGVAEQLAEAEGPNRDDGGFVVDAWAVDLDGDGRDEDVFSVGGYSHGGIFINGAPEPGEPPYLDRIHHGGVEVRVAGAVDLAHAGRRVLLVREMVDDWSGASDLVIIDPEQRGEYSELYRTAWNCLVNDAGEGDEYPEGDY